MSRKVDDSDLSKVTGGGETVDLGQNPPGSGIGDDAISKEGDSGDQPGPTGSTSGGGTPDMGQG